MKQKLLTKMLLVAVCMLTGANASWAGTRTITYDFKTAAASGGITESSLTKSETSAGTNNGAAVYYPSEITSELKNLLAFQYNSYNSKTNVWAVEKSRNGLWVNAASGRDDYFSICNLKAGDVVKVFVESGLIYFSTTSANCTYDDGGTPTTPAQWSALVSEREYTIKADGKLDLQAKKYDSGRGHTTISKIVIETSDDEVIETPPTAAVTGANGGNRTVTITGYNTSEDNATKTYYTLDGTTPTSSSNLYSTPFTVSTSDDTDSDGTVVVKAISYKDGDTSIESGVTTLNVTGVGTTLTLNAPSLNLVDFTKSGSDYYPKYTFSSDQTSVLGNPSVTYTYTIGGTPSAGNVTEYAEAKAGTLIVSANAAGYNSATTEIVLYKYSQTIAYDFTDADFPLNSNWTLENADAAMKSGTYVDGEGNAIKGKRYQPADDKVNEDGYLFDNVAFSYNDKSLYYYVSGLGLGYQGGTGHNTTTITISGLTANSYTVYEKQLSGNPQSFSTSIVAGNNTFTMNKNSGTGAHVLQGIYVYNSADKDVVDAIADCKTYETSATFATAIDAESFASAAEVYAFHTAWQIAQADAASSNDITKVIFDAAVSDFTRWNNARNNKNEQYTGAPDNKYFDGWDKEPSDGKQKIYGLPAGTYTIKVATRASETLTDVSKYKVWVYGGSADVSVLGNHIGNTGGVLGNGWNWTILSFTLAAKADVEIGFYTSPGNSTGLWAGCDDWHLYKGTLSASATVGANGYTTFASPYPLDLTDANRPAGLKAYKATLDGKNLSFTKLNQTVPAGTGLLLLGETKGGSYDIPVASSVDEITTAFTGVTTATALHSVADDTYYFVMRKAASEKSPLEFAPLSTSDVTIPAGKAYITVSNSAFTGGGARALDISFDDEETTGISDATRLNDNEKMINDNFYDLSGRKVAQPTKGLYIVNGKKVIIK